MFNEKERENKRAKTSQKTVFLRFWSVSLSYSAGSLIFFASAFLPFPGYSPSDSSLTRTHRNRASTLGKEGALRERVHILHLTIQAALFVRFPRSIWSNGDLARGDEWNSTEMICNLSSPRRIVGTDSEGKGGCGGTCGLGLVGQMSTEPAGTSGARSSSSSLVATRFVWPHGGFRVFLCGSFTRWQDMIPMLPIEGCSSVFQVVCSLTPGYHQFKFVVDGEWRHDDKQPYVTDSGGNSTNCILVRDIETGSRSGGSTVAGNMDVEDGEMNMSRASLASFSSHHELPLDGSQSTSAADCDASRQRIDNFLTSHTAYELLPDSGKVVALDILLPIKQAFHVLYEQGIPLAPLWDSVQQQFVGMLTASDFIAILMQIRSNRATLSEEELETHTIAAWKNEKIRLADSLQRRHSLVYVGPDDSLKEVVRKLLRYQVTTVPVLYFQAQEQTLPQLLHLATLSGILKCLCRHFQHSFSSLPLFSQPIGSLRLGTWRDDSEGRLVVLRLNYSLSTALTLFNQGNVAKFGDKDLESSGKEMP
ncbi:hypothetical protein KP509_39G016000 [Ceratopteris richardii]|uniref:CBS domain-containing protein n=1 Tax=Ceratopteris richardii TaxID=49495 RepID=A0A8T2PZ47_CERRI|nr:hypothetical protein KP509_39G016000 [Ceratopteris richardii]